MNNFAYKIQIYRVTNKKLDWNNHNFCKDFIFSSTLLSSLTCSYVRQNNINIISKYTHNLWKFGRYTTLTTLQTWIIAKNIWKYLKQRMSNIKMFVLIRHTFCEILVKMCVTKRKNSVDIFWLQSIIFKSFPI